MAEEHRVITVGRRKCAIARVWLERGSGNFRINGRELTDYFPRAADQARVTDVFKALEVEDQYDLFVNVKGGGITGQAEAIRLGMARYFLVLNPELRAKLKPLGFLRRDPRAKERKKYGQKRARKRFQFSKR